jgi:hypothetical protein
MGWITRVTYCHPGGACSGSSGHRPGLAGRAAISAALPLSQRMDQSAAASPVGSTIHRPVLMSLAYTIPVSGSIATPQTSAGPWPIELARRWLVGGTNWPTTVGMGNGDRVPGRSATYAELPGAVVRE